MYIGVSLMVRAHVVVVFVIKKTIVGVGEWSWIVFPDISKKMQD